MGLADRIVVMHQGRIEHTYNRADATPENIVAAASGCALPAEEWV